MARQTHVIVGASLAGTSAAIALRKEGFDGRIVLIGEEPELPYERPDLSKKYLRGEPDPKVRLHDAGFYEAQEIELRTGGSVEAIDVRRRAVVSGDERLSFDRLLLATGARARRPDIPGVDLDGVVTLRTTADADHLRTLAREAGSAIVVGGGWIGAEAAASLRQMGHAVTLIVPGMLPLERALGPEVATIYREVHEEQGVRIVSGSRVAAFDGRGRVTGLRLADGRRIAADLVVLGLGAEPRTELAFAAELDVSDGIDVDERLETSAPGIFAAGDVANAFHPGYGRHLRVEHWDNARRQGRTAAANLLGRGLSYERIPYAYSDQFDLGMERTGLSAPSDRVVFRGDPATREFIAFWIRDERVVAGMNVNVWDVAPAIERLIASGDRVDLDGLLDVSRPLGEVEVAA